MSDGRDLPPPGWWTWPPPAPVAPPGGPPHSSLPPPPPPPRPVGPPRSSGRSRRVAAVVLGLVIGAGALVTAVALVVRDPDSSVAGGPASTVPAPTVPAPTVPAPTVPERTVPVVPSTRPPAQATRPPAVTVAPTTTVAIAPELAPTAAYCAAQARSRATGTTAGSYVEEFARMTAETKGRLYAQEHEFVLAQLRARLAVVGAGATVQELWGDFGIAANSGDTMIKVTSYGAWCGRR